MVSEPASEHRLRIVHCFRNPVGGLFRHVRDLSTAQAAAGHEVGIICDSRTGGAFEEQLFAEIKPTLALGLQRIPMRRQIASSDFAAATRPQGRQAARPQHPTGHGAKGGAYARIASSIPGLSGVRVARIYTPHGGSMHYDPRSLRHRVYFAVERMLERLTDAFIFVSRYEADAYAAKVHPPRQLAEIVLNGLRPEEFDLIAPQSNARDFLYVGMLRDLKGPDVFIRALAMLRESSPDILAHIYGAGDDADRYHALVAELGLGRAIAFHDPVPAKEAFATGRVLVIPSRAESMPYIVLEAAAAGMPMIATAVGGIPEVFGDQSARLVPPGDVAVLTAAMAAARSDAGKLTQDAADLRQAVRSVHTVAAMAEAVERVYRRAIGSRR